MTTPISELLRELVDEHSPRIYDDPAGFAGLLDDVLSESDATPGQANLLVDAVRFGAVPRLARAAGRGADPARVVVAHFFFPATVVPLVEVVPSEHTDSAVLDQVQELLTGAGKTVVRLRKDVPGFVANRLQAALLREAIHLVEEGVLDVAGIDEIVTASIGVRWSLAGPFRISDLGGLDVWSAVCGRLWPDLGTDTVPTWLQQRVAAGEGEMEPGAGPVSAVIEGAARAAPRCAGVRP